MDVVSRCELILDDDSLIGGLIHADQVEQESPDRVFGDLQDQIHPEFLAQDVGVLQQPGREVASLVAPYLAGIHRPQPTQYGSTAPGCTVADCHGRSVTSPSLFPPQNLVSVCQEV